MSKLAVLVAAAVLLASCSPSKTNLETKDSMVIEQALRMPVSDSTNADPGEGASAGQPTDVNLDFKNYQVLEEGIPTDSIQSIDSTCVIFVWPSNEQLEKMKRSAGSEEEFYTGVDDFGFYMSNAARQVDTLGIKVINAERRYLKLKSTDSTRVLDIRKDGAPEWNIIFFSTARNPKVVSFWDIVEDKKHSMVREYFNLK